MLLTSTYYLSLLLVILLSHRWAADGRNPKFDGRMFAKMQVTDSVEQNKIRLNCYKYITKGMNQKRANVKYAVYKKYLSK
jgi:hypothetical protein